MLLIDDDELGQIDIYLQGSPFFNNDIKLMRRWAVQQPEIANLLDNVVSIVTLMVIWSRSREETLELITPLFEWLASSKIGVLMDEGGRFYVGGSIELAA